MTLHCRRRCTYNTPKNWKKRKLQCHSFCWPKRRLNFQFCMYIGGLFLATSESYSSGYMVVNNSFTVHFSCPHLSWNLGTFTLALRKLTCMNERTFFLVHYCYNGLCWGCSWMPFFYGAQRLELLTRHQISAKEKQAALEKELPIITKEISRTNR